MVQPKQMKRRKFLKGLAAGAGVFAVGPTIVPSSLFGANAPSNQIIMGAIGVGGRGSSDMRAMMGSSNVRMVAVCDVEKSHRDRAKASVDGRYKNKDCRAYNDFREITRRGDIDAVVVGTPDHWHVLPAIDAAKHGMDSFVEKPLTLTIRGGRALADMVSRYGRILQTGSQQRSAGEFRKACELVRNGYIGELKEVHVGIPGNNKRCGATWEPQPVPAGFDYDFWLGPAPWEPYHQQRCHYQFRFILDYSGGQVTNWGAHFLDIAQWGLGMDDSGPVEIIPGDCRFPTSGLFTTATKVDFTCVYANGVRLTCKTGGANTRFVGTKGWVDVSRGRLRTEPGSLGSVSIKPGEIHLYRSGNHVRNFLECIRTRKQPICNAEVGHRSACICHLGNIAMILRRSVRWDPKAERFINDSEADRMTCRPARVPWGI